MLAALGVRRSWTLGVDGGIHYPRDFHDLNGLTRLANGQDEFRPPIHRIHRTAKEFDMDYGPLTDRSASTSAPTTRRWPPSKCWNTRFAASRRGRSKSCPCSTCRCRCRKTRPIGRGPGFRCAVPDSETGRLPGGRSTSTPTCSCSATSRTCGTRRWARWRAVPGQDTPPVTWQNNAPLPARPADERDADRLREVRLEDRRHRPRAG